MSNNLVVIENGKINTYRLDDRILWEVGRPSKDSNPDIKLYSPTVSRKHGRFQNTDGIWYYTDYFGKNGTVFNNNKITRTATGFVDPEMMTDGDVLVFGGGEMQAIDTKTVWALFKECKIDDKWRIVDTKKYSKLKFSDGISKVCRNDLLKGDVIELDMGMAIYMGDVTFLAGSMKVFEM